MDGQVNLTLIWKLQGTNGRLHQEWLLLGATNLEATLDIGPQGLGHQHHLGSHTEGLRVAELECDNPAGQERA